LLLAAVIPLARDALTDWLTVTIASHVQAAALADVNGLRFRSGFFRSIP
jgi:hypothetical protein